MIDESGRPLLAKVRKELDYLARFVPHLSEPHQAAIRAIDHDCETLAATPDAHENIQASELASRLAKLLRESVVLDDVGQILAKDALEFVGQNIERVRTIKSERPWDENDKQLAVELGNILRSLTEVFGPVLEIEKE